MRGDVAGCIVHSDRNSQFRSRKMLRVLACHRRGGPTGRVGSIGDNAAVESFFALLQNNIRARGARTARKQLRIAMVTWTRRTHHRRRRQARPAMPNGFENIMDPIVALVA